CEAKKKPNKCNDEKWYLLDNDSDESELKAFESSEIEEDSDVLQIRHDIRLRSNQSQQLSDNFLTHEIGQKVDFNFGLAPQMKFENNPSTPHVENENDINVITPRLQESCNNSKKSEFFESPINNDQPWPCSGTTTHICIENSKNYTERWETAIILGTVEYFKIYEALKQISNSIDSPLFWRQIKNLHSHYISRCYSFISEFPQISTCDIHVGRWMFILQPVRRKLFELPLEECSKTIERVRVIGKELFDDRTLLRILNSKIGLRKLEVFHSFFRNLDMLSVLQRLNLELSKNLTRIKPLNPSDFRVKRIISEIINESELEHEKRSFNVRRSLATFRFHEVPFGNKATREFDLNLFVTSLQEQTKIENQRFEKWVEWANSVTSCNNMNNLCDRDDADFLQIVVAFLTRYSIFIPEFDVIQKWFSAYSILALPEKLKSQLKVNNTSVCVKCLQAMVGIQSISKNHCRAVRRLDLIRELSWSSIDASLFLGIDATDWFHPDHTKTFLGEAEDVNCMSPPSPQFLMCDSPNITTNIAPNTILLPSYLRGDSSLRKILEGRNQDGNNQLHPFGLTIPHYPLFADPEIEQG
ncbi:hypothetical protein HK096_006538, partial [Nowakowskiella sp. JEL0078]